MKVYLFEIFDATHWSKLSKINYLPRLVSMARGDDIKRLENIIKRASVVNSDTVSSIGKKVGMYITPELKVWWNLSDSKQLGIDIKYNKKLACERILTRSGFKILGINENGPHRIDGPAVINEKEESEYYYINGELHREDGPAVTFKSGYTQWYINGRQLDDKEVEIQELYILGFDDIDINVLWLLDLM